ncbi:E3 SUMO-protein ligase ZBED1-like [Rhopalosiphum padi]|uniref:E3 SUMO-protein ligase ZBED1-like n=1 Tax=Rhopalosiphum padi TaxID=40932 RepID=UPI00298EC4E9|nr:E3 SUMO-protein ligase ZBED1-like [Rhopalosiphum padi]
MASSTNQLYKKRSNVWNHFTLTNGNMAKCNYCNEKKSFSGGSTGNLLRHIKTKHVTVPLQRSTPQVAEESNSEYLDNPQPSTSASQSTSAIVHSSTTFSSSIIQNKNSYQSSIANFIHRPLPLLKEYHPFSIVEDKEFRKLLNMLSPNYIIPSRKTVSNSLLPQMYEMVVQRVKDKLKNVSAVYLTTDGWTSRNNESFLAVTAHFIDPDNVTELSSVLLACTSFEDSHTADNLALFLKNTVDEWGLSQRITVVVSDNAANIKSAIEKCNWRRLSCFAHDINLIVHCGLGKIEPVVTKIKDIVSYFKRSSHALAKLQEYQKQTGNPILKLKQDCPTRWNSTFDMFDRILRIKEPIIATLAILNNTELNSLTPNEWQVVDKSKELLKIFYDATVEISAEKNISISKKIIMVRAMFKVTQTFINDTNLPREVLNMANTLKEKMMIRFDRIEDNLLNAQATVLDPRFKKHGFINEDKYNRTISQLRNKLQSSIRTEQLDLPQQSSSSTPQYSNSAIWGDFDKSVVNAIGGNNSTSAGIIELDKYLNEQIISRHENPLLWWSERQKVYPRLYEIVKTRLCIIATSVPCERLFSKAGQANRTSITNH